GDAESATGHRCCTGSFQSGCRFRTYYFDDAAKPYTECIGTVGLCRKCGSPTSSNHTRCQFGANMGTAKVCHATLDRSSEVGFLRCHCDGRSECFERTKCRIAFRKVDWCEYRIDSKNYR